MASSAQTSSGFVDPYAYNYGESYNSARGYVKDGQTVNYGGKYGYTGEVGLPGMFTKIFGYDADQKKAEATRQAEIDYERQSIDSARAWSEYMDSTQYQRRVEDLKKAGLNPWLAVQNGISGTGTPSVDTGGSAKSQTDSKQSSSWLAQLLMAIAKFVS